MSIVVDVDVNGKNEEWVVCSKMKPITIPRNRAFRRSGYGGDRDPPFGRSYVYQAMRVTGSGDPRTGLKIPFRKLPRKNINGSCSGLQLLRKPNRPLHRTGGRDL